MKRIALCITLLIFFFSLFLTPKISVYAGSPVDVFNPGGGPVSVLALQTDGKILVAGNFATWAAQEHNRIVRLNANGSVDATFNASASDEVTALVAQADGKILIGGRFTSLSGQTRSYIGRLNGNGSLDSAFNPDANGTVSTLAVQADGKILVGGDFARLGGADHSRMGRLNPDGSLDTTFNPGADNTVNKLVVQADGKILVSGAFATLNGETHQRIGRLNADGSLDTSFTASADGLINNLAVQANGKILVAGDFATLNGVTRSRIGRLNADGSLDSTFNASANSPINTLAVQPDGKILVGGAFSMLVGKIHYNIGRLNADGSLDTTFNSWTNNPVTWLALQTDGQILIGGSFTMLAGQLSNHIARVNTDGSLDTTFNPQASSQVYAIAVQPDGKIVLGGNFDLLGGQHHSGIGRINANGSPDATFTTETNGSVNALYLQPDGKILVGGYFTAIGGQTRNRIARLNADGSVDLTFNPGANYAVYAFGMQPDGKILVGGGFVILGGQTRNYIGRLNPDGSLDADFNPGADGAVTALIMQPDGKILVGGGFSTLGGGGKGLTARDSVGQLNPDGSLDTAFVPGPVTNGMVWSMAVQTNGKIILSGSFTTLGGQTHNYIGRLNADGSLDTTFEDPDLDGVVYALGQRPDGRILLGGDFSTFNGQAHGFIGQLPAEAPALQDLSAATNGSSITWARSGSSPEIERVTFEMSSDGITYSLLGPGTHVTGGWRLTGLNLPKLQTVYIRARGSYTTGNENGSFSMIETVRSIFLEAAQNGPIYTVNTAADHDDNSCSIDDCTLREAINAANAHTNATDPDEIHFNIPTGCDPASGVCTIAPATALPAITDAVKLDGYTQPGASVNTIEVGDHARLLIELNGENAPANTDGLTITAGGSTVRGLVINRFTRHGININNILSDSNLVVGNFIGTNADGSIALGNAGDGIHINGSASVGGTTPDARNVISGNGQDGIYGGSPVQGNYIGTDASGTISLGNQRNGVYVAGHATIGGSAAGAGNLISGNGENGVYFDPNFKMGATIEGNFIGTDVTGTLSLGNGTGVKIENGYYEGIDTETVIGRNLISGNRSDGIVINNNATRNYVIGNFIGTDVTGTLKLGNAGSGLVISHASNNRIGGWTPPIRNIISGNGDNGILISNDSLLCHLDDIRTDPWGCSNVVQGNYIGTDVTGTAAIGNGGNGIYLSAAKSMIGGTRTGEGNLIRANGGAGVAISGAAASSSVLVNAIFANNGLGIDLEEDGVTQNDAGDADTGANNRQNFPVLTSVSGGYLNGTLNSTPGITFRVEFFANTTCDPSGYGEGEQFLGALDNVTTDSSGSAAFSFPYNAVAGKPYLTATAAKGGDTSEFSACFDSPPPAINTSTSLSAPVSSATYGESVTFTATVSAVQGSSMPTGQVQFREGSAPLGLPVTLDDKGQATYTTSTLDVGDHTLSADFIANAAYNGSSGSTDFKVSLPEWADLNLKIEIAGNVIPQAGSPLSLVFSVTNSGTIPAASTVLTIDLPAELSLQSAALGSDTPCEISGSRLTCPLGDLAPTASQTVTVHLNIAREASGEAAVIARLTSPNIDPSVGESAAIFIFVQPRSFIFLPLVSKTP